MYSSCYKQKNQPLYGYGSPPGTHGIKNVPPRHHKEPYEFHNKMNTSKNHGTYGRVKDPFKAYRNSKHHVVNMTKYYDRKDPFQNPKVLQQDYKTEMTFRRFRPKSANVLVKDQKIYEDPRVNPHFIYNRNIYEEYRSSLGSRQRLDGSLIDESRGVEPDDSKARDESLEKQEQEEKKPEEAPQEQKEEVAQAKNREGPEEEEKKKEEAPVAVTEPISEKKEKKVLKRPYKTRKQRPQSAYVVRKPSQSKSVEDTNKQLQVAKAHRKKLGTTTEKPKETKSVAISAGPLQPVQQEVKKPVEEKEIQVNKSELSYRHKTFQEKKETRQPVILVTSEYRRSFSPPPKYCEQPPVFQQIIDDKKQEQKKLSNTTYRADFSPPRTKKQFRSLQSIRPAGVCSILGMVTYN